MRSARTDMLRDRTFTIMPGTLGSLPVVGAVVLDPVRLALVDRTHPADSLRRGHARNTVAGQMGREEMENDPTPAASSRMKWQARR